MTKAQSLLKALQDAEIFYFQAQQRCVHWNMESDGCDHDCCQDLSEARQIKQAALRAYSRTKH